MRLNYEERQTVYKIVKDIMTHRLLNGTYDAKNGKEDYMYGIGTLLEYVVGLTDNIDYQDYIMNEFYGNMATSEKKC